MPADQMNESGGQHRQTFSFFSKIVDSVPTAVVLVDEAGNIAVANERAEILFRYPHNGLLGKRVESLIPTRFRGMHPELRSHFNSNPKSRPMGEGRDLYALRKDGSEVPVEIGLNPIQIDEGTFVLAAILDLTERKRSEAVLRESEERFRMLADSAPVLIWMSGVDKLCTHFNKGWLDFTGRTMEQELGNGWADGVHPDDFDRCLNVYVTSFDSRRDFAMEYRLRRHDGEYRWILDIGVPRSLPSGEFSGYIGSCIDITGRKELEATLQESNEELERRVSRRTAELSRQKENIQQANEALARSNLDLQRFAYVASHDLQSPLRSIAGFVQLLKLEYENKLDGQADEWIRRTIQSVERLQASIHDLLAFSRIDANAQPFVPIPFRDILNESLLFLEATIKDSRAEVTCDELPAVMGDRSQLIQLMQNLIGNALKYRSKESPRIHVSAQLKGIEWHFSVRDNGIGVHPKYHARIFEFFQRVHNENEYPGTGIGLAVCRHVVTRLGGKIWVESEPGRGSTFRFTIPKRSSAL